MALLQFWHLAANAFSFTARSMMPALSALPRRLTPWKTQTASWRNSNSLLQTTPDIGVATRSYKQDSHASSSQKSCAFPKLAAGTGWPFNPTCYPVLCPECFLILPWHPMFADLTKSTGEPLGSPVCWDRNAHTSKTYRSDAGGIASRSHFSKYAACAIFYHNVQVFHSMRHRACSAVPCDCVENSSNEKVMLARPQ